MAKESFLALDFYLLNLKLDCRKYLLESFLSHCKSKPRTPVRAFFSRQSAAFERPKAAQKPPET